MKLFRKILRYWFAIASVLSFLGGWAILAHSPKPVQPQAAVAAPAALPSLPPIQAYGGSTNNNGNAFFSNQTIPMLRTRGS